MVLEGLRAAGLGLFPQQAGAFFVPAARELLEYQDLSGPPAAA